MSLGRLFRLLFQILFHGRRYRLAMAQLRAPYAKQTAIAAILAPYRLGDYETALRAADGLKEIGPGNYHFFRGSMLLQLGRLDEAEDHLRKSAVLHQDGPLASVAYSSLGRALLEGQKYEEALQCFETSLRHAPERGAAHCCFAELFLHRGNFKDALDWAEKAVEKERAPVSAKLARSRDLNISEDLATLAWAIASTSGDHTRVDRIVEEAVAVAGLHRVVSSMAHVHVNCGKAYAALGDPRKSKEHLDNAGRLDPNGVWGRAAKAAVFE